jgi:hypothetical protein
MPDWHMRQRTELLKEATRVCRNSQHFGREYY